VALLEMTARCAESCSVTTLLRWIIERFRFEGGMILYNGARGGLALIASAGDIGLNPSDRETLTNLTHIGNELLQKGKAVVQDTDEFGSRFLASALDSRHVLVIQYGATPPAASDLSAIIASLRVALRAALHEPASGPTGVAGRRVGHEAGFNEILGSSPSLKKCKSLAERYALQEEPILITGESGTGKELFARAVHALSVRHDGPFIAVNCAAIPSELIEAELFGVAPGAATGVGERKGKFQAALGGVLFLDEVGDLPLGLQGKLLRVLELGEYYRVGDDAPTKCDVRIISATNRDLEAEVRAGRFRADLYYRLHVLRIHIPPLRQRRQDIPILVNAFIEETASKMHKPVAGLTVRALEAMTSYDWPGNVRELRSEIIRAVASLSPGAVIDQIHLSMTSGGGAAGAKMALDLALFQGMALAEARDAFERMFIRARLEEHGGNRTRVAEELKISRAGLFKKMKRLNIQPE
jgi:transcriptional regulator with PAS, ATPase and Fis domain